MWQSMISAMAARSLAACAAATGSSVCAKVSSMEAAAISAFCKVVTMAGQARLCNVSNANWADEARRQQMWQRNVL